ncbi:hypothetical protein QQP08_021549 [Theobroma cacao]|nr:hypothetical protein QQP08_021549 [Theobroma cacao]
MTRELFCGVTFLRVDYVLQSTLVVFKIGALPRDLDQSLRRGVLVVVVHEDRGPAPSALSNSWAEALWFSY